MSDICRHPMFDMCVMEDEFVGSYCHGCGAGYACGILYI